VHAPQVCNLAYSPGLRPAGAKTYGNDCERERAKAQKGARRAVPVAAPGRRNGSLETCRLRLAY